MPFATKTELAQIFVCLSVLMPRMTTSKKEKNDHPQIMTGMDIIASEKWVGSILALAV